MKKMATPKVLVACEFSGTVRRAFRAVGIDAFSCDLLPSDDNSPYHYQCDALTMISKRWDLIIGHPPCTYLANSGVRWLVNKDGSMNGDRFKQMLEGVKFFNSFLNARCKRVCVENPIQHIHARELIGYKYSQIIQPWMFGHGETKATCLWLKGLPNLEPTNVVKGRDCRIHKLPPSKDRWKIRSKTYDGIAKAMAEQWGKLLW